MHCFALAAVLLMLLLECIQVSCVSLAFVR